MAAKESPPADSSQRTHFADLVRSRRLGLRLSFRELARRAVDPRGVGQVKSSWLHRLESGEPVIPPQFPQLRALAVGLDLPVDALQDAAAAQFFGIDAVWSRSGEARAFVARAERLTEDQRAQLLRLLDTFVPPPTRE